MEPGTIRVEAIPAELKAVPQWVVWKWERRPGEAKPTKPPYHPCNYHASHSRPSTWSSFQAVLRAQSRGDSPFAGIGFVFSEQDPYAGVDLDGCIDLETGEIAPWAAKIVSWLDSYTEISPSGTGLKVFVSGKLPGGGKKRTGLGAHGRGSVEMYDRQRFFTLTGRQLGGTPDRVARREAQLAALYTELFTPAPPPPLKGEGRRRSAPEPDDERLLLRARRASNGAKFEELWRGDESAYDGDHSRADLALCGLLAFWTGGDRERIDRLFRQSGLMREKWDARRGSQTYGERTVTRALQGMTQHYQPGRNGGRETRTPAARQAGEAGSDDVPADEDGEIPPAPGDGDEPRGSKANQATVLVELAVGGGAELFHSVDEDCFATIPVEGRRQTWRLKSTGFRGWLQRQYLRKAGKVPGGQALQDALNTLCGLALLEGEELPVQTRVAERDGAIYVNLGDEEWRVVEVTASGWRVLEEAPVRFRRARGMKALPAPRRGGSVEELRPFVNVREEEWALLVSWLVAALRPSGPYPILELHGEQGSAKSTTARVLRGLIDPNLSPLRAEPKEERDVAIAAKNSWVIAFDNLSNLYPWLSDALCRIATGGGLGTRELYTNDEEALFDAQRPVILNGIGGVANRSDLLDRSLLLNLPPIPEGQRRTEREFQAAFEAAQPRILGALLDAVSTGLRNLPHVKLERLPRMADFAEWVTAAEPGLGWPPGTFMEAYTRNRSEANSIALEASPIGELVLALVRGQESGAWEGTAKELLDALLEMAGEKLRDRRDWPKNARSMAVALRRIAPNLRAEGVEREDLPRENDRRVLRLSVVHGARPTVHGGDANGGGGDANGPAGGDAKPAEVPAFRAWGDANGAGDANSPSVSACLAGGFVPAAAPDEDPEEASETWGELASLFGLRHEEPEGADELGPEAQERLETERLAALRREVRRLAWERDWPEGRLDRERIGPGRESWGSWLSTAPGEKLERVGALLREQAC